MSCSVARWKRTGKSRSGSFLPAAQHDCHHWHYLRVRVTGGAGVCGRQAEPPSQAGWRGRGAAQGSQERCAAARAQGCKRQGQQQQRGSRAQGDLEREKLRVVNGGRVGRRQAQRDAVAKIKSHLRKKSCPTARRRRRHRGSPSAASALLCELRATDPAGAQSALHPSALQAWRVRLFRRRAWRLALALRLLRHKRVDAVRVRGQGGEGEGALHN